jgi:hypothetical protein
MAKTDITTTGIGQAMVSIMRDVKAIGKDSSNSSQGFKFRGIDAVMNNLHPIFAKHGVIILPEVLSNEASDRTTSKGNSMIHRVMGIRYRFIAEDGTSLDCTVSGEAMDSGDKSVAKCMAIALKYALSQSFLLPYDEIDPDAESHEETKPAPAPSSHVGGKPFDKSTYKPKAGQLISEKQGKLIYARSIDAEMTTDELKAMLKARFGFTSSKEITADKMDAILDAIAKHRVGDAYSQETPMGQAMEDGASDDAPF